MAAGFRRLCQGVDMRSCMQWATVCDNADPAGLNRVFEFNPFDHGDPYVDIHTSVPNRITHPRR